MDIPISDIKSIISYLQWHPGECVGEYGACKGCDIVKYGSRPLRKKLELRLEEYIRNLLVERKNETL